MPRESIRIRMDEDQLQLVIKWCKYHQEEYEIDDPIWHSIQDLLFRLERAVAKAVADYALYSRSMRRMVEFTSKQEQERRMAELDEKYGPPPTDEELDIPPTPVPTEEIQMPRMPTEPLSEEEKARKERMAKLMEDTRKRYEEIHSAATKDSHENNDSDD